MQYSLEALYHFFVLSTGKIENVQIFKLLVFRLFKLKFKRCNAKSRSSY